MATVEILADYLTQAELAKQVRRSIRTLERWDRLRIGPVTTVIGKQKLYHIDDVRVWLKAQRRETKPSGGRQK